MILASGSLVVVLIRLFLSQIALSLTILNEELIPAATMSGSCPISEPTNKSIAQEDNYLSKATIPSTIAINLGSGTTTALPTSCFTQALTQ